ncbi:class F sortase [Streptomyces sp. E2N166]|uniref:class F sortase n=1 Tax=Streptomyces sp. E2N166 TaxID=1851909 RepID=UPI001EE89BBF|nr:class F sortase [Streptomyces sp. E2N166]
MAAAALAAVLGVSGRTSNPGPAPPDFGSTPSGQRAATAPSPDRTESQADTPLEATPERVRIPDVGLDARVRPVGVTEQGAMTVPEDPSVSGWYRYGPVPGSPHGSAVLVGHVDSDTGALGEFAALYEVQRGDRVEVRRAKAAPAVYRVVSRATVPKDELPPSVFRRTGAPVLTLITCAPPFVPERGGYRANLVVTAEPLQG